MTDQEMDWVYPSKTVASGTCTGHKMYHVSVQDRLKAFKDRKHNSLNLIFYLQICDCMQTTHLNTDVHTINKTNSAVHSN